MTLERIYDTDTRLLRFTPVTEDGTAIADAAEVMIRLYSGSTLQETRLLSLAQVTNHADGSYSTRFGPLAAGYYVVTATGMSVAGEIQSRRLALLSEPLAPEGGSA